MSDLVLDNGRRRDVADALGMSFGRARALRRLARRAMSMGELAAALGTDPPNATVIVDELERLGLVTARPASRPTGARRSSRRRAKGRELARRADEILEHPAAGARRARRRTTCETLRRILGRVAGSLAR